MSFCKLNFPVVCVAVALVGGLVGGLVSRDCRAQDYRELIGYFDLVNAVGPGLEDGTGIDVSMVEANIGDPNQGEFRYLPNANDSHFVGKTIIDGSGLSTGPSGHATSTVGRYYFGNQLSMAPGVTQITGYEANDWINRILAFGANNMPLPQNFRVSNHSYVGDATVAQSEEILKRLDQVVNADEIFVAVGVPNSGSLRHLQAQGYNSISVGRSDGNHSFGLTSIYGAGRVKPEIVVPVSSTSRATGVISSAATLLSEKADNQFGLNSDAARTETIKAVLLGGATKSEFSSWDRTSTRPLDQQFGAGELNILNSYMMMQGGEFDGEISGGSLTGVEVDPLGWDYGESLAGTTSLLYEFNSPDADLGHLSIALTWNMDVFDDPDQAGFDLSTQIADLDLRLFDSSGSFMGSLVDESVSPEHNVEHLFFERLSQGTYTLEVINQSSWATDFGLAWRYTAIPEPAGSLVVVCLAGLLLVRRRC